jgi:hypothetical protein
MDVLTLGHCSHEFSWPRRAADGHYYQVCLNCASEYKYDWQAMRRTERVDTATAEAAAAGAGSSTSQTRKQTWVPRARRLKLRIPVRYRVKFGTAWYEGMIENLSQSGVLLQSEQVFPPNTLLEMIFEMPEEISGQKNSTVVCQGQITRSNEGPSGGDDATIAATVLDYKFLHQS